MMNHAYLLRFRLFSDAPPGVRKKYTEVYDDIVSNDADRFEKYLQSWLDNLRNEGIGTAVDTQFLNRPEGGIGGDSNKNDRQIRFYNAFERKTTFRKFGEITLRCTSSDDGLMVWSMKDLFEFGGSFKESLKSYGCEIDFYIAVCPLSV